MQVLPYILPVTIGIAIGFGICLLIGTKTSATTIANNILRIIQELIGRLDKLLTGNDGRYSHVRFINLLWGIGNYVLIFISIIRGIPIPGEVLVFMGSAMGASHVQAILNKIQEVKQVNNNNDV